MLWFNDKVGFFELQDYVPYIFSRERQKENKKRVMAVLLSIIFVVLILVIVISLVLKPKNDKYFKEISFYFVYTDKSPKQTVVSAKQDQIKSLGGSGEILHHDEQFFLIANVYFSSAEANEIISNISSNFTNSGVVKITKKLKKSQKRVLKDNESALEFFMFLYNFVYGIQDNAMKYIAGSISESRLCTKIMGKKLELEGLINKHKNPDDELSKYIFSVENIFLLHLNRFLDEFFTTTKKQSALAQLVVNLVLAQGDLYDNL